MSAIKIASLCKAWLKKGMIFMLMAVINF